MVGSVRAITNSAGQVVARFEYEPFGLLTISTGPMAAGAHRFTGKPEDSATELYYFGARYYDPEVGGFISRDPICHGLNWYSYCSLNPLAYSDPNGLREEPRAGSGVIQSEAELLIVETQEKYHGCIWDSRNPAPFTTQFFAWLNYHPEVRHRVWGAPDWPLGPRLSEKTRWLTVAQGALGIAEGAAEFGAGCLMLTSPATSAASALFALSLLDGGVWSFATGVHDVASGFLGCPTLDEQLSASVGGEFGLTLGQVPDSMLKWVLLTLMRANGELAKERVTR